MANVRDPWNFAVDIRWELKNWAEDRALVVQG